MALIYFFFTKHLLKKYFQHKNIDFTQILFHSVVDICI